MENASNERIADDCFRVKNMKIENKIEKTMEEFKIVSFSRILGVHCAKKITLHIDSCTVSVSRPYRTSQNIVEVQLSLSLSAALLSYPPLQPMLSGSQMWGWGGAGVFRSWWSVEGMAECSEKFLDILP